MFIIRITFIIRTLYLKIIAKGGNSKHVFKRESRTTKTTEEIMKTSGVGPWADGVNQRNQEHRVLRISSSEVLRR